MQTNTNGRSSVQTQPGNPTFAVLKATAIQQALGHPLNYARVLMQVKIKIVLHDVSSRCFRLVMNHCLHIEEKLSLVLKLSSIRILFDIVSEVDSFEK